MMDLSQNAAATNGYPHQSPPINVGQAKGSPPATSSVSRPSLRVVIPNSRGEVVSSASDVPVDPGDNRSTVSISPCCCHGDDTATLISLRKS